MTWSKTEKKEYMKQKKAANKVAWYENLKAGMESNNVPWRKQWKGGSVMPMNVVSKKHYKGGNIVSLWFWAMGNGYTDMRFGTRNQLKKLGMSIKGLKNGEGCLIKFFKQSTYTTKDKKTDEEVTRTGYITNWWEVFCVEQCEDYEAPKTSPETMIVTSQSDMMKHFNAFVETQGIDLKRQGNQAFYRLSGDLIQLPKTEDFETPLAEVATSMHEAIHSTGHPKRCERNLANKFGSAEYAFEELVAELGSLILTLSLGGEFNPHELQEEHANSQAYLKHWLKACDEQDSALDRAFSQAQAAADFVLANCSILEEVIA